MKTLAVPTLSRILVSCGIQALRLFVAEKEFYRPPDCLSRFGLNGGGFDDGRDGRDLDGLETHAQIPVLRRGITDFFSTKLAQIFAFGLIVYDYKRGERWWTR
jgi:hypothetical protein